MHHTEAEYKTILAYLRALGKTCFANLLLPLTQAVARASFLHTTRQTSLSSVERRVYGTVAFFLSGLSRRGRRREREQALICGVVRHVGGNGVGRGDGDEEAPPASDFLRAISSCCPSLWSTPSQDFSMNFALIFV